MSYDLDWSQLANTKIEKESGLDFEQNKGKFTKVAFDVYQKNDGTGSLWEMREGDDGQKYLFALYDQDLVVESKEEKSEWTAVADSSKENITLAYKKTPVFKFSSDKFGFSPEEAASFADFIVRKASKDSDFVNGVLENSNASQSRRKLVAHLLGQGE